MKALDKAGTPFAVILTSASGSDTTRRDALVAAIPHVRGTPTTTGPKKRS
jgi:hypothetical protein